MLFLGVCRLLLNPPGPSPQPWRPATSGDAAPGRNGAHSLLIVQLPWSPRSSSAPTEPGCQAWACQCLMGARVLSGVPSRLDYSGTRACSVGWRQMEDSGWPLCSVGWGVIIRAEGERGARGIPPNGAESPTSLWQGFEPHLNSSAWAPLPDAHCTPHQGPPGKSKTEGNEWMNETNVIGRPATTKSAWIGEAAPSGLSKLWKAGSAGRDHPARL